ncbi:MAG: hypothetical protein IKF91_01395 [Bacilli bacterium]|nr:hypothetical protein [Bacilli bacterium]
MLVKINGQLIKLHGASTMEGLKQKIKRPHLCQDCSVVACVGRTNLKNVAIKNAIKAIDGVYVLDCDDFVQNKNVHTNVHDEERLLFSSPTESTLMHPNLRHIFIR